MAISLSKGQKVSLTKEKPGLKNLMVGLEFYNQLCELDEDFFIENGYSLVKAREDFESFAEKFGLEQMTELYFGKEEEKVSK